MVTWLCYLVATQLLFTPIAILGCERKRVRYLCERHPGLGRYTCSCDHSVHCSRTWVPLDAVPSLNTDISHFHISIYSGLFKRFKRANHNDGVDWLQINDQTLVIENSGDILLYLTWQMNPEFWDLESGIQLKEYRIQVPLIKNLEIQLLKSEIHCLESPIQDCLGFT